MASLADYTDQELEAMAGSQPDLSSYSDEELAAMAGPDTPAQSTLAEVTKSGDQKNREALAGADAILAAEYPDAGIKADAQPQAGDITTTGQALAKRGKQAAVDVGPTALRVGVPLAATVMSGGVALPAAMAFTGTGALLGEEAARAVEGRPGQTPLEGTQTLLMGGTMAPLKVAPGLANTFIGGALEGSAMATQGTDQSPLSKEGGFGAALDIGARLLERRFLRNAEVANAAQTQQTYRAIGDQVQADTASKFQAGINEVPNVAGVSTPVDDALKGPTRARDFDLSRQEQAAKDLEESLRANQAAGDESIIIENPIAAQQAKLDVNIGPGEGAVKERARLAQQAAATPEAQTAKQVEEQLGAPLPRMSSQASRMMDEYGGVHPAVIFAGARAMGGAAAGASMGDTMEEKLGYGLLGALGGAAASPALAARAGKYLATETSIGRTWLPEVTLTPFMDLIRQNKRDYEKFLTFPKFAKAKLTTAINEYKDPVQREQANRLVYEYMTGRRHITTLPVPLAEAAQDARKAIDDLSDELIVSGVAQGQLRDSIASNMGAYLRRSYKLFTEPGWKPQQAVFDKWVDAHVADTLADPKNTRTATDLKAEYTKTAQKLIDRNGAEQFITGGQSVDQSIFKPRKNLDGLTRELLGEIDDPLILLSDTAPRMARNAAVYTMQKNIVDLGEKLGLMTRQPGPEAGRWTQMAAEEAGYTPFAGVWASPELKQAYEAISKQEASKLVQTWAAISSAVKLPKTLGSLKAYSSNVWGGVMDTVAQGHALQFGNFDNWKTAGRNAGLTLGIVKPSGAIDRNAGLRLYRQMVGEGLINRSVSGEDFLRTFEKGGGKLTSALGGLVDKASKVYMTPEGGSKVFNLAGEMSWLKQAYPGKSPDELFKMAAARVRATTADYDYLPGIVKKLSMFGGLDPFIAYTADRFRVVYNTYNIALDDIASGNPALQKAGYKRIASMTAVLGAAGVIGSNSHLDPRQEEALRNRLPERDRNGFLRISEIKPDGSFTYTNLNYNIPQSIVTEAGAAAMRGDDPVKAAKNAGMSLAQQLFGANLIARPVSDVLRNETERGGQVYSENDPAMKQVGTAAGYLAKELFMPLVINELDKARKLATDNTTQGGAKYTAEDLAKSNLAGIRIYRRDLNTVFRNDAAAVRRSLQEDQTGYSSAKRRALTEADKQAAYETFEARRKTVHDKVAGIINDARTLGSNEDNIVRIMREAGVPAKMIAGAMNGIYLPSSPVDAPDPSDILDEWAAKGIKDKGAVLAEAKKLAATDRQLAVRVADAFAEQYGNARRGVTEADRLLLSFGVDDGSRARFVAQKFSQMREQDAEQAAEYIRDLRKKGILTPDVYKQVGRIVSNQ